MRFYEKLIQPIPLIVLLVGIILINPFQLPPDPKAKADVIVEAPKLVERTPEAAKAYAKTQLSAFNWDNETQWQCLLTLWTKESNWRPDAYNRTAVWQDGEKLHAGGIPQILGLDPDMTVERQIARGFIYISSRYSTPCSAWRFWVNNYSYQSFFMANEEQKKPSAIDDALAEIGRVAFVQPAICTGWVLVSEWMGEGDREYWTLTLADDQNPDWRHLGLVHHGLKNWEGNDDVGFRDGEAEN